ncbi:ATP-binding protein [Xylophilus sp. GOD-11R]|uniref:ATP-binding protein n=1 Tax=Xylophilus sp. GOD-11R TaxID=3089814 RepID=UPI00298D36C2|nr:ATP-binding protein [Xylophilus sp. GOD-11R]WPB58175.1 ATP-binding protein [Xylophilus sp. GOD-11R]
MSGTTPPVAVALLGAESTGKTALAQALAHALRGAGQRVALVSEALRDWCESQGRPPRAGEQRGIAEEQARRVDAVQDADIVIADTTPLMTAVYSDHLFQDRSLYPFALQHQRRYAATLLTGLDLPWLADGVRDGPHTRGEIDGLVRAALGHPALAGLDWRVVYGQGDHRLASALAALGPIAANAAPMLAPAITASWRCLNCDDAGCEHRLFTRLKQPGGSTY